MQPALKAAAICVALLAILMSAKQVRSQTPVSIELVIAVDTSISIDGFEYGLLMKGIAKAFRTPEIINLIGRQNGVAVALFQWSSEVDEQYMIPWRLLQDPASVLSFALEVENAERDPNRVFTGIGGAIDFGVRLIAENAYEGRQMKIDISGDGRNNVGRPLSMPRRAANALGIVINGLPILTQIVEYSGRIPIRTNVDYYGLETYYRKKVIHGPGAFVEIANDYDDFARAFLRKLIRELSPPPISRAPAAPRAPTRLAHADRPDSRWGPGQAARSQ